MGLLSALSTVFGRKKKTTVEVLEEINEKILALERARKSYSSLQKRIFGTLILYSILFFMVAAVAVLIYAWPLTLLQKLLCSLPFIAFPFLVWVVRYAIQLYFMRQFDYTDAVLEDLRREKERTLDEVMDTMTYKKAQEVLERFDPLRFHRLGMESKWRKSPSPPSTSADKRDADIELKRRPVNDRGLGQNTPPSERLGMTNSRVLTTPIGPRTMLPAPHPPGPSLAPGPAFLNPPAPPRLSRPLLSQERSFLERMLDVVMGDGPNSRYALICRRCASHNGMALAEEFEYLSFRCGYCGLLNPAHRIRPMAPMPPHLVSPSEGQDQSDMVTGNSSSTGQEREQDLSEEEREGTAEASVPAHETVESGGRPGTPPVSQDDHPVPNAADHTASSTASMPPTVEHAATTS